MAAYGYCAACKSYRVIQVSVIALVSSLGTREHRKQKSTKAVKFCLECLGKPVAARHIMRGIRALAKEVRREAKGQTLIGDRYGEMRV